MTSISAAYNLQQYQSPKDRIQNEINAQAASGEIKTSDVQALTDALDQIDTAMSAGRLDASAATSRPAPGEISDKIGGLIDDMVQNGKLTTEQADDLKGIFAEAGPKGPPPGGPPPSGAADDTTSADGTSTDETSSDVNQLISDFLKLLKDAQSTTSGYSANGSASTQSDVSQLFNYLS